MLTRFVGEHGLAYGTRPHSQLSVLCRFRVASQVLAQTTLVHVVFSTHGTGMVGRPAFRHVGAGADVGVACKQKRTILWDFSFIKYSLQGFNERGEFQKFYLK